MPHLQRVGQSASQTLATAARQVIPHPHWAGKKIHERQLLKRGRRCRTVNGQVEHRTVVRRIFADKDSPNSQDSYHALQTAFELGPKSHAFHICQELSSLDMKSASADTVHVTACARNRGIRVRFKWHLEVSPHIEDDGCPIVVAHSCRGVFLATFTCSVLMLRHAMKSWSDASCKAIVEK